MNVPPFAAQNNERREGYLAARFSFLPAGYARSVSKALELLEAGIVGIACAGHRHRGLRVAWTTNRGAIGFAYRR
jgi:hypothetical protein